MKVELILPRKDPGKLVQFGIYVVPVTLTQLAAVTPAGIELRLTDENISDVDPTYKPDLTGISVMTSQVGRATEISRMRKAQGSKVIWGGIHPTIVNQTGNESIDSFCVAEAEEIWPQILADFEKGQLKKEYSGTQVDLNKIPLPRRGLLKPTVDVLVEAIITSRGCPRQCSFCAANAVYGRKIRYVSAEKVEDDIRGFTSQYGAFVDDNFFTNTNHAKSILEIASRYGKRWFAEIDPISASNEEFVEFLSKAGVRIVLIGFESVNPANFEGNSKYIPPSEWNKIVDMFHRHGIKVEGLFMFGFDNDKEDVFEKTKTEIKRSGIDFAAFSILTPYPGTRLYEILRQRIFDRDWSHYDLSHVVYQPKHLTPDQLMNGVAELRRRHLPVYTHCREILTS